MYHEILMTFVTGVVGIGLFSESGNELKVDDQPAKPEEWNFRPLEDEKSQVNPPGFVWRPQENAEGYILQVSRSQGFDNINYEKKWHLQAGTTDKKENCQFVTVIRPYRKGGTVPIDAEIKELPAGYVCKLKLIDGEAIMLLRTIDEQNLMGYGVETDGDVCVICINNSGEIVDSFVIGGTNNKFKNERNDNGVSYSVSGRR